MTTETLIAGADTSEAGGKQEAEGTTPAAEGTQVDTTTPPEGTTPEGTEGEKTGEGTEKKTEATAVEVEFKVPDGVELDQPMVDEFKAIVGDDKLTASERAQKLADLFTKREQAQAEAFQATRGEWVAAVKADKEIGGDKLPETLAVAKKALDLGPPELRELLNSTGMGDHPAVVRWAYAVGKALSEDRLIQGDRQSAHRSGDIAERLYGSSKN